MSLEGQGPTALGRAVVCDDGWVISRIWSFWLAVIEGTLQAYYFLSVGQPLWARAARPIYAPNPNTVFWNKANLSLPHDTKEFRSILYTNRQGLRVSSAREEFDEKKDPSRFRILFYGSPCSLMAGA